MYMLLRDAYFCMHAEACMLRDTHASNLEVDLIAALHHLHVVGVGQRLGLRGCWLGRLRPLGHIEAGLGILHELGFGTVVESRAARARHHDLCIAQFFLGRCWGLRDVDRRGGFGCWSFGCCGRGGCSLRRWGCWLSGCWRCIKIKSSHWVVHRCSCWCWLCIKGSHRVVHGGSCRCCRRSLGLGHELVVVERRLGEGEG